MATPTPQAPDGRYGAYFWIKLPRVYLSQENAGAIPALTPSTPGGTKGNSSAASPYKLVAVRLGLARDPTAWKQDRFLDLILTAVG